MIRVGSHCRQCKKSRQVDRQQLILHFHREARRTTEVINEFGRGASTVDYARGTTRLLVTKGIFLDHLLYEGVHFTLSMDGEIEWL